MTANLTGRRFGRLVAQGLIGKASNGRHNLWRCVCDCGRVAEVSTAHLRPTGTQSCGCLTADVTRARSVTHGKTGTKTHNIWSQMRRRCREKKGYADRGISVCARWLVFENFLSDMGECPPGLTIERVENDKGYDPDNCVWGSHIDQANNRRSTTIVTYEGRTQSAAKWAAELGINPVTLRWRLRQGWPISKALQP